MELQPAMGLLDDLKQQADTLRQKEQVSQEEINQNLLVVHARLKETLHYWVELFNSLNVVKPQISRTYYLEGGATRLEGLQQSDYNVNARRLTVDHRDYIEAIMLRFRCASEQRLTVEKQSDGVVQRMREHLWANNLKFDLKEIRNERGYVERGIFTVPCEVPVTIVIAGDLEKGRIKITCKNLEQLGEYTNVYDLDEFGKPVLEELGKVIVMQPNGFRLLGRHQESLRVTTVTRPPRPEPETAPAAEAPAEPVRSFFGSIKSILKR